MRIFISTERTKISESIRHLEDGVRCGTFQRSLASDGSHAFFPP